MLHESRVYKCEVCGNIAELLVSGGGQLFCCGQNMTLLEEQTDETNGKHIPVFDPKIKGIKVTVGSIKHPMDENHYIQFIELIADNQVYRKELHPGDEPVTEFCVRAETIYARAYCNVHGLWKSVNLTK